MRLQIQEVTEAMRENVQKVMERGERLEDLQEASDRLSMAGNEFRTAAKKAQQRAWLQNFKTRIVLVAITVTVVICIIGRVQVVIGQCMISACSSFIIHFMFGKGMLNHFIPEMEKISIFSFNERRLH